MNKINPYNLNSYILLRYFRLSLCKKILSLQYNNLYNKLNHIKLFLGRK